MLIVERWLFGRLRHRVFYSLAELNAAIAELMADLNDRRVMRAYGQTRRQMCGSAPKRDPALMRRRRSRLFKKAIFDGVPISADLDPAQLEIPEKLEVFSSDTMGSRFGAYPQPPGLR